MHIFKAGLFSTVCAVSLVESYKWFLFRGGYNIQEGAVEGGLECYVLHRVLYPQVHVNGVKKKQPTSGYLPIQATRPSSYSA